MSARPNLLKIWQEVSRELEAHLDYTDDSKGGQITETIHLSIPFEHWKIEFTCFCKLMAGEVLEEYTKMRSIIHNPQAFRFNLYQEKLRDRMLKIIGLQDIIIGEEILDKRYIVQSNNEAGIKKLMGLEEVREVFDNPLIQHLRIIDDELDSETPLPPKTDLLFGKTQHRMQSKAEILAHYKLFTVTLKKMESLSLISPAGQN